MKKLEYEGWMERKGRESRGGEEKEGERRGRRQRREAEEIARG